MIPTSVDASYISPTATIIILAVFALGFTAWFVATLIRHGDREMPSPTREYEDSPHGQQRARCDYLTATRTGQLQTCGKPAQATRWGRLVCDQHRDRIDRNAS